MSFVFCFILGIIFGYFLSVILLFKKNTNHFNRTSINIGDYFLFYDKKYPNCSGLVMVIDYNGSTVRYVHYSIHEKCWTESYSVKEKHSFLDIYKKVNMEKDEVLYFYNARQYAKIKTF